jgi:hypothetical protein
MKVNQEKVTAIGLPVQLGDRIQNDEKKGIL